MHTNDKISAALSLLSVLPTQGFQWKHRSLTTSQPGVFCETGTTAADVSIFECYTFTVDLSCSTLHVRVSLMHQVQDPYLPQLVAW